MDSRVHLIKAMTPAPGSEEAEFIKEKRNLSKNKNMTQKHDTAVKRWSPLSFCCFVLPDLSLVFFPEMSVSQPFPKGSGDN